MVTFQIPAGPKNLALLFPDVDFSQVEEYSLQLIDLNAESSEESIIMTTNQYKRACCCSDETFRVFFVNYLGGIDSINLRKLTETHETQSTSWNKPLKYPLEKWDGGKQRFNVRSNETIKAENICYGEDDQDWIQEFIDSPNVWLQWTGTQDQDDDYIPVVVKDQSFEKRKQNERYIYVLTVELEMANENIIPRN